MTGDVTESADVHGTHLLYDEAVRYCFAVADQVDWPDVDAEIHRLDQADPLLKLLRRMSKSSERPSRGRNWIRASRLNALRLIVSPGSGPA